MKSMQQCFPCLDLKWGRTLIKITKIQQCLTKDLNVHCGFKSYRYLAVIHGTRLNEDYLICISPPDNGAPSTEIFYSVFIQGCLYDLDEVKWNAVGDVFDHDSDLTGVIAIPLAGVVQSSRLIYTDTEYIANRNSDALLTSAKIISKHYQASRWISKCTNSLKRH